MLNTSKGSYAKGWGTYRIPFILAASLAVIVFTLAAGADNGDGPDTSGSHTDAQPDSLACYTFLWSDSLFVRDRVVHCLQDAGDRHFYVIATRTDRDDARKQLGEIEVLEEGHTYCLTVREYDPPPVLESNFSRPDLKLYPEFDSSGALDSSYIMWQWGQYYQPVYRSDDIAGPYVRVHHLWGDCKFDCR